MSTKSREVISGGQIAGAKIRAEAARKRAAEAVRAADRRTLKPSQSAWKATAARRSRRQQLASV
jgi:hypothetical protein